MVLTRRAYKAISRWLPNEIIAEIVQAAPRSDQASLCRVSKLFRDLCRPILYRVVDLETNASVPDFRNTVFSNAALAGLVRSYSVHFPRVMSLDALKRFSPILVDSSKALVQLEALSIDHLLLIDPDAYPETLLPCTFPHLVQCSLGTASMHWNDTEQQHTLASFLIRHPELKKLHIKCFPYRLRRYSTSLPPARSGLKYTGMIMMVTSGDLDVSEIESTFVALKAMTASDIPFICSNDKCDKNLYAIVDSLSRNLPHTRTLQLHSFNLPPLNEVIDHPKNCLPRFTGLAFLSVHNSWHIPTRTEEEISVLVDACPTLEACHLHGMWETYPLTDFDALAGLESWTL
ncbi:hypothetical protein B0H17DRAFT_1214407 [Mycena rosella]|uniref:F-box domain-containing protein n=1 Tax=Mycena rosella TaxID=1033263 RepID=A0AAD7CN32_MYCRO|nr:hypothetical protein B0H17DRAFT_1214407 [Mycena rosella]